MSLAPVGSVTENIDAAKNDHNFIAQVFRGVTGISPKDIATYALGGENPNSASSRTRLRAVRIRRSGSRSAERPQDAGAIPQHLPLSQPWRLRPLMPGKKTYGLPLRPPIEFPRGRRRTKPDERGGNRIVCGLFVEGTGSGQNSRRAKTLPRRRRRARCRPPADLCCR
jgi:hypothetical protein